MLSICGGRSVARPVSASAVFKPRSVVFHSSQSRSFNWRSHVEGDAEWSSVLIYFSRRGASLGPAQLQVLGFSWGSREGRCSPSDPFHPALFDPGKLSLALKLNRLLTYAAGCCLYVYSAAQVLNTSGSCWLALTRGLAEFVCSYLDCRLSTVVSRQVVQQLALVLNSARLHERYATRAFVFLGRAFSLTAAPKKEPDVPN